MDNIIKKFQSDFPSYYEQIYSNNELNSEPLASLDNDALNEILSVISSCLTRANYEQRDVLWQASYIAVHIASRQILKNGNKRLSLYVLCVFLMLNNLYLVFEKNYYADTIKSFIQQFETHTDRTEYMENFIITFSTELKDNSKEWSEKMTILDTLKALIPPVFRQ